MLVPGKVNQNVFGGLPRVAPSASGAIPLIPARYVLDASSTARQMTIAAPTAKNIGQMFIFEALSVAQTCDLDYTDSAGAQTKTFSAVGQVLILYATESLKWFKVAGLARNRKRRPRDRFRPRRSLFFSLRISL